MPPPPTRRNSSGNKYPAELFVATPEPLIRMPNVPKLGKAPARLKHEPPQQLSLL